MKSNAIKKIFFTIAGAAFGLASCTDQQCQDCECALGVHDQVCREDFDTQAEYEDAIATNEATGCDCEVEI